VSKGIIAPYLTWSDEPVDVTADQAIAAAFDARKNGGARQEAKEFLRELLKDGLVDADEGEKAASAHGISESTLKRARKDLGVRAVKSGFKSGWAWVL
jgi:hypothetical protein